jgi:hypothetical protein
MGIRSRKATDLPQDVRQEGAARVRQRIRQLLSNPFLTPQQTAVLHTQLNELSVWERGEELRGESQVVELDETVPLSDE